MWIPSILVSGSLKAHAKSAVPKMGRGWGEAGKEAAMCDLDDLGSSKTALNNLEQYLIFVLKASMGQGVIMPLRCLVKGE